MSDKKQGAKAKKVRIGKIPETRKTHTPGPWITGFPKVVTLIEGCDSKMIFAEDPVKIFKEVAVARKEKIEDWDEVMANAYLIAAAPDLLRLLEVMTAYAARSMWEDQRVCNNKDLLEEYDNAIRDAERAIKKAKGDDK